MNQKKTTKLLLILVLAVLLIPNLQAKRKKIKPFDTTIAGYKVAILPRPENISMSNTKVRSFEVKEYSFDDNQIYIIEDEFVLNKKSYGFLKKGDEIELLNGEVFINKVLTAGIELDKSERVMLSGDHPFAEAVLGVYSVTVAPGSNLIMEDSDVADGITTYTYLVGNTTVKIFDNILEVNGKNYGELPEGAKIVVEEGVVKINEMIMSK